MATEFKPWPKIARLNRGMIITEKIDGTNAAVVIDDEGVVRAQSRTRIITPDADNFGFARWVYDNAGTLVDDLGPGYHYGEWWGKGIQRHYGQTERFFSLFNVGRWDGTDFYTPNLKVVPVLCNPMLFSTEDINEQVGWLSKFGSVAAPGFDKPEGVVVYHTAAKQLFKVTLENDDQPKGLK